MIDVGQTVGNYRITAELGEGGMGKVFLAEHPVIGRKAALKVIHPQFARNADVVARFVNEARAVTQIGHAHIVEVTDFGHTEGGDFYFIMEYLDGEKLSDLVGRRFSPARATNIAVQIADALEASHQQGVIHRDLKPDNILLVARDDTPDFVKVFDFGLAKLTHKSGVPAADTEIGIVMGTPFYMSPEQCDARRELDHRADIYALGVILFQMLTGQVPYSGDGFGEVMAQHLTSPAPSVRALAPEVPPALDAIVGRAMAKDREARFQTMAELREALLATARGEAGSVLERAALPGGAVTTTISAPLDLRPAPDRRVSLLLGIGAFAFVAVANLGLRHRASTPVMAASRPTKPATVLVNFSSDPAGATVSRRDGSVLGVTPFSTQIPYRDLPVEYVIRKRGYVPKVSSFVPNLPLPVFAVLERIPDLPALNAPAAEREPVADAKGAGATPERAHHHARPRTLVSAPPLDADDIMKPSTW